jgi:hypothetical protein
VAHISTPGGAGSGQRTPGDRAAAVNVRPSGRSGDGPRDWRRRASDLVGPTPSATTEQKNGKDCGRRDLARLLQARRSRESLGEGNCQEEVRFSARPSSYLRLQQNVLLWSLAPAFRTCT